MPRRSSTNPEHVYPILTTIRPRTWPARMAAAASDTPESAISRVIAASFWRSRSVSRRFHASCRRGSGHMHRIDAVKTHPAQNKRGDRAGQVHAAGKAAGGHRPAIAGHRQQVGERRGADRVDCAGPALLGERLGRAGQLLALDDLGRAQAFEIIGLLRPAGRRACTVKAALGQQGDRHRADAAGGAGHRHRAAGRA